MSGYRWLTYAFWFLGFASAAAVFGHWPWGAVTIACSVGCFTYWSTVEHPRYWRCVLNEKVSK